MKANIDKNIAATVEEFNKSKHIRTVYSCAGHKRNKDQGMQVYIQFEMKKKYLPIFLALAVDKMNNSMATCGLSLKLCRVCIDGWPKPKKERISISFDDLTLDIQVLEARGYFKRLSDEVMKLL